MEFKKPTSVNYLQVENWNHPNQARTNVQKSETATQVARILAVSDKSDIRKSPPTH
jgi:hypothetical protein